MVALADPERVGGISSVVAPSVIVARGRGHVLRSVRRNPCDNVAEAAALFDVWCDRNRRVSSALRD